MFNIMFHLSSEIRFQKGRKFFKNAFKRAGSWQPDALESTQPRRTRENSSEMGTREDLTGKATILEVDETMSCTPLFSKALETIVLKRLKEETRFRASQYGGQKGCGADNFLVQTWQEIVYGLEEDQACTNHISVDFEKAFNRMAHRHCLVALREHGASNFSIRMASAFLLEQHMQVRICLLYTSPSPRD